MKIYLMAENLYLILIGTGFLEKQVVVNAATNQVEYPTTQYTQEQINAFESVPSDVYVTGAVINAAQKIQSGVTATDANELFMFARFLDHANLAQEGGPEQ